MVQTLESVVPEVEEGELFHAHLISESLFRRISNRIAKEEGKPIVEARKILDGALGFLFLCAKKEGNFSPSPEVDIGWHAFLMYTMDYAEFCERVAGYFIHHCPTDEEGVERVKSPDTTMAFVEMGIAFHPEQWKALGSI